MEESVDVKLPITDHLSLCPGDPGLEFYGSDANSGGAFDVYKVNIGDTCHAAITYMGPRNEPGSHAGVSDAAILAVVIHRLKCFQAGAYSCRENAIALTHLETALMWMHSRTQERHRRNVLGKNEP